MSLPVPQFCLETDTYRLTVVHQDTTHSKTANTNVHHAQFIVYLHPCVHLYTYWVICVQGCTN